MDDTGLFVAVVRDVKVAWHIVLVTALTALGEEWVPTRLNAFPSEWTGHNHNAAFSRSGHHGLRKARGEVVQQGLGDQRGRA